jgi:hypothetical protein
MGMRNTSRFAGVIKRTLFPSGGRSRAILTGPFQGIRMELDPQCEAQMWLGLTERELFPLLEPLCQGIRSAVDIGAAVGEYTLYALLKTSAERVIAFEPQGNLVEALRRNLDLNGLGQDPRLELHPKFLRDTGSADSIAADRLAEWVLPPCFLKMDIEGGELAVLRAAASRLLSIPDLRWLIETHNDELHSECAAILKSAGYSIRYISQAWWRGLVPERRRADVAWLVAMPPVSNLSKQSVH